MSLTRIRKDKNNKDQHIEGFYSIKPNDVERVSAGATYNTNEILGFRLLNIGTGTLTFTPSKSGSTPIVISAAELTLMGSEAYSDFDIACSSVTAGLGMEILAYIQ